MTNTESHIIKTVEEARSIYRQSREDAVARSTMTASDFDAVVLSMVTGWSHSYTTYAAPTPRNFAVAARLVAKAMKSDQTLRVW